MIFPNTALIGCFQIRLGRMTTAKSSGGIQTVTGNYLGIYQNRS
jgi:hypothetical protein